MEIPFINLRRQYESIHTQLDSFMDRAIHSFRFSSGSEVHAFEDQFAALLRTGHCVSTANGTDSLFLALKALGAGSGDEVITPAFSWISSAETISTCGATPVFIDVDGDNCTLNANLLSEKVTQRTKGIVAVHLYGQSVAIPEISDFCRRHKLFLVEDCAQAHLTSWQGQYAGTFGNAGCFSFYPTKNLGAYGDAGCVVTSDRALAEKIRRLANHGALVKDDHEFEGVNSRMDTLQAAVLLSKLPHLQDWNRQRQKLARQYTNLLEGVSAVRTPAARENSQHTFHLYVIRAKHRDRLKQHLGENGVQTIIHYPKALTNLPAYRHFGHLPSDFPVASALQEEVLSLPLYPELTEDEVAYTCEKIRAFYKK